MMSSRSCAPTAATGLAVRSQARRADLLCSVVEREEERQERKKIVCHRQDELRRDHVHLNVHDLNRVFLAVEKLVRRRERRTPYSTLTSKSVSLSLSEGTSSGCACTSSSMSRRGLRLEMQGGAAVETTLFAANYGWTQK